MLTVEVPETVFPSDVKVTCLLSLELEICILFGLVTGDLALLTSCTLLGIAVCAGKCDLMGQVLFLGIPKALMCLQ